MKKKLICYIFVLLLSACAVKHTNNSSGIKLSETAVVNTQLGMAYIQNQDYSRAKQKLLLAIQQAPELPEVWYSMAYYQEVTGNHYQAKDFYTKALNLAPKRGDVQNNF